MVKSGSIYPYVCALSLAAAMSLTSPATAADFYVASPTALQAALNSAQGGDTIVLAPGAYVGNFKLPVHAGTGYVTVRTMDPSGVLPAPGTRIRPDASPNLARLMSSNSLAALRTAAGAAYWRLELLEIGPGPVASTTLVELGDGSSAQNTSSLVPHHLIVDRLYVHGDRLAGQKRAFGLNSGDTSILNSYVADIKAIGVDSQALAGWNGPGPYQIENNYFEAAGTSVLFGGDDPRVPYQLPSDITFRDNTVTRPVSWRDPILPTPGGVRASFVAGGSLAAGTYGYRVVARRMIGTTQVKSAAAAQVTVTVAQGSTATIQWNAVQDATDYLVYGRTPGAVNRYWVVKGTSFNDDGIIASLSGTPSAASVWQTKNLFELKAARRVEVSHNLFSNNWAQAQSGTAILFTTRNQGGNCGWCVVEDVTFENNVVKSVGGGFQVTGWDNLHPSLQGNNIRVRNNLIADLSKTWGGKGYLATITDRPRDITFDHNTVISPDGTGVILADGGAVTGFVFTNNVARHNTYGIFGSGYAIGNKSIAYYFPGSVITRNVLAAGSASVYPAGNLFPTITGFESHFVAYLGGNYALVPGTDWEASGTDGKDLGADPIKLVGAGSPAVRIPTSAPAPASVISPLQFNPITLPDTTERDAYSSPALVASGGVSPYVWTISAGATPSGIYLDSTSGVLMGSATWAGDYQFTVRVQDVAGTAVTQPLSIHVNRAVPPVMILTSALNTITSTVPTAQALDATGGLGTYTWSVTGALPAGITLSTAGVLSGTTTAAGTYSIVIKAADAQDATRSASQAYSLYVAPPPNHAPTVSLSTPTTGAVVPVGSTITITANAADVDGNLARVDLYVGTTFLGTSGGPRITLRWLVPTAATYQFSAIATDARGETAVSQTVTIATKSEIVLYASDAKKLVGNYQLTADASAAGGTVLWNPDLAAAKLTTASGTPVSYAEFTFYAEAGRAYHLWIRGRAQKNSWANDSAYVQFSGVAAARIGSTTGLWYNIEADINAGVSGWGWEDNGWGTGVIGANVVFETTGLQTLRIQPREDGLYIDQIVLSPQQFLTTAPGVAKNDTTILAR
jgi:hypothetical protein